MTVKHKMKSRRLMWSCARYVWSMGWMWRSVPDLGALERAGGCMAATLRSAADRGLGAPALTLPR
eukprot:CAMPEP_0170212454 /NCGR_PEP_ID=MMETSP0116_2-20130129/5845_1 /TAXON_ID=400756 /ORGANISM="Durinskia baltica, Strain CSIRO CS-38" /LENGTH=64 /DNA_ID=CAMNT_0010462993 /DNA_START=684 /DNA_END=875 /DNA_ORIENTATION=-